MYIAARMPLPKLYGSGRLLLGADEVDIEYVIWRWQIATQLTPSVQPFEHDAVFAVGVLAATPEYCCRPEIEAAILRLEDGTECAVKLSRLSNPALWEFHVQFLDGPLSD